MKPGKKGLELDIIPERSQEKTTIKRYPKKITDKIDARQKLPKDLISGKMGRWNFDQG